MRNIITIGTFLVSFSVLGITKLDVNTSTEKDYRDVLMEMLSQPTKSEISKVAADYDFWTIISRADLAMLRSEADTLLAAKNYGNNWRSSVDWPKISEIRRQQLGVNQVYSNIVFLAKEYKCNLDVLQFAEKGASIDTLIVCLNEMIHFPKECSFTGNRFDDAKRAIQKAAVIGVKKALRKQGKSFVTVDGVNPCEQYMERLNTALNAPRFAGLNDWLTELEFRERVDISILPSSTEITALKDSIFYGEKEMTALDRTILSVCLGVDGFNAFVKEYNGE